MSKILLVLLLLSSALPGSSESFLDQYKKKISKELANWSDDFSKVEHIKTVDVREFYQIKNTKGEDSGILVLSSAKGRFDDFDLMTVVVSGKVDHIRILKYRSEYGSEVSNKKWLAQFYTQPDSAFIFRKNVDAISGATFSAQGMVSEVNEILKALVELSK